MNEQRPEPHDVIVIGAGQAGLATSQALQRRGIEHLVLESDDRIGDQWRSRYDSLLLYSPARYDGLPGMRMPLPPNAFPTGHQMADYLESYAAHFELPVRTGVRVDGLRAGSEGGARYTVSAGDRTYEAGQVVIAAGFFKVPHVPDFAGQLDPSINQVHSSDYMRPSQLADGPVLVVGLSHSGADMAMEAMGHGHPTIVSGKGHGQLPFSVDSRVGTMAWPLMRFLAWNLLTIDTPIGRKMRPQIRSHGGAPLLRHRRPELLKAGIELTDARTVGVEDGRPVLADGRVLDVANVIWCTGFRPDYGWIHLPIFGDDGFPVEHRGVVSSAPGLYFVGLLFQYGFTSMLVLGAGRDAAHVADRVARESASQSPMALGAPTTVG